MGALNKDDSELVSSMRVSDLIEKLQQYSEDDVVKLNIWGSSDYPSIELRVNDDILMSDEF